MGAAMVYNGSVQVVWQYQWHKTTWVDFPPDQSNQTELAFVKGEPGVYVQGDDGRTTISIDFESMKQDGKCSRCIRRVAVLKDLENTKLEDIGRIGSVVKPTS